MCSDSEKNMSAFADQNHAPSLTYVRLEFIRKNQVHPLPVVVKIFPDQGIDFFETIDQRGTVHIHGL